MKMEGNVSNNDKRIRSAVMDALGSYSVIRFPLKAEEIYHRMPVICSFSALLVVLEDLTSASEIFKYKGYYSADPEVKAMVLKRIVSYN